VDETSPTPFILLMMFGFLLGCGGHLYKSPATVATGIAIAFLATAAAYVVYLT
jgi:biopolymer transport protein ExbB/TolQ